MASRLALGLRPANSPSLTVLMHKKSADNTNISPSKLSLKKQAFSPAPPVIVEANKENAETQTICGETSPAAIQTDVSAPEKSPEITSKDLTSEYPTSAYYRVLHEGYEKADEAEFDRSLSLLNDLDTSIQELQEVAEAMETLNAVEADILEEQKAKNDASGSEDAETEEQAH